MARTQSADQSTLLIRMAVATLKSTSPYSQGKHVASKRGDTEPADVFEDRTWRERMHVNKDGRIFIPPMAFKNSLAEAAKFLSLSVPGKGKATFTKHFEAGIMTSDPLVLPILAKDVQGETLFVPADGRRGSGSRVNRTFPLIPEWEGKVTFIIFDSTITPDIFLRHLRAAGTFIGIGRFRPRNNGFYGRYQVLGVEWSDVSE